MKKENMVACGSDIATSTMIMEKRNRYLTCTGKISEIINYIGDLNWI